MRDSLLSDFERVQTGTNKILEYFECRLKVLRIENDGFNADVSIRGRIAEIKDFIKVLSPGKKIDRNKRNCSM